MQLFFDKYEKTSWDSNWDPQDRMHKAHPLGYKYTFLTEGMSFMQTILRVSVRITYAVEFGIAVFFQYDMPYRVP